MSKPTVLLDGMGRLFRETPELQAGVHMKIVGESLCAMGGAEAQAIGMSIMDASLERDAKFEEKMEFLVSQDSSNQRAMAAKLIKYKGLPVSDNSEELPDNFDLMDSELALETLIGMGKKYEQDVMDIYHVTDHIVGMSPDDQKIVAVNGFQDCGRNCSHLVPLGLEIA